MDTVLNNKSLGPLLKQVRKFKGYTASEVSAKLHCAANWIYQYESRPFLKHERMVQFCQIYNISITINPDATYTVKLCSEPIKNSQP